MIGILARAGERIEGLAAGDPVEALGINDRKQLAALAAIQRQRTLDRLMEDGVTIIDPASTYIEETVTIGPDTVVYPDTVIEGDTTIGSECVIGAGCQVSGSHLADRVVLKPYCVIAESTVERGRRSVPSATCGRSRTWGPRRTSATSSSSRRRGWVAGQGAPPRLSRRRHGGPDVNVGAGTITCNYDGVAKHPTTIEAGAFIGTNASLVAPVTIGAGAYVGAGSVITRDVPPGALAVERAQQTVKEGWAARRAKARPPQREG